MPNANCKHVSPEEAPMKAQAATPPLNGQGAENAKKGWFDSLPSAQQFALLTFGMFVFFGAHNVLQEAISSLPGFNYSVMLGYMEVIGVTICSFLERKFVAKEKGRKAPMSAYPLLTLCLLSSSALSNHALNYINFPTKVVFRSCKLVPTMLIATIMNKRHFSSVEYVCALFVCAGLVVFSVADWKLTPSFNMTGIILVSLSVVADSVLPNAQERLFNIGATRLEVTFYTNLITLACMTFITLMSGDLVGVIQYAMSDSTLIMYMVVFTAVAYVAISTYMQIVKRFGGVAAVLLATARKGMTLILSFLLFPKAFSWYYVLGATFVLGGLLAASLIKQKQRRKADQEKQAKVTEMKPLKGATDHASGNYSDAETASVSSEDEENGLADQRRRRIL